jgi:hypothetical protein
MSPHNPRGPGALVSDAGKADWGLPPQWRRSQQHLRRRSSGGRPSAPKWAFQPFDTDAMFLAPQESTQDAQGAVLTSFPQLFVHYGPEQSMWGYPGSKNFWSGASKYSTSVAWLRRGTRSPK